MATIEDWPKKTFDFPGVTTVDSFAKALCISREEAAMRLLQYPYPEAVPAGMLREATAVLEDDQAEARDVTAAALVTPAEESAPAPSDLHAAVEALSSFMAGEPLTTRIASLEKSLAGQSRDQTLGALAGAALPKDLLSSSLLVRQAFGRVNDVIHAAAILAMLPELLLPDEEITSRPSLAAGVNPQEQHFDLETSHRVAEFKVALWTGADSGRKRATFADFARLSLDTSDRKKQLFVVGNAPIHFLEHSDSTVQWAMSKASRTLREQFELHHPDDSMSVADFRRTAGRHVEIHDLAEKLPELTGYTG